MVGQQYAYRVLWEEAFGLLPKDIILHHECENKWCVNLNHLKPITQSDHAKLHGNVDGDWGQADKTHCVNGHPYNDENTYVYHRIRNGRPVTERHCKRCVRAAKIRYRARKKAGF